MSEENKAIRRATRKLERTLATMKATKAAGDCYREKYWSEIGLEEKAERMRAMVKNMLNELEHLRKVVDLLTPHKHDHNGDIVVPFNRAAPGCQYAGGEVDRSTRGKDDVYF